MKSFKISKNVSLLVLLSIVISLFYYLPYCFSFIGTDNGVYYQVSKQLFHDGYLGLFKNYWDHKPLLIYLWYLPFHVFDVGFSSFGITFGSWLLYFLSTLLVFTALYQSLKNKNISIYQKVFYGILCSLFLYFVSLGWHDRPQNGIIFYTSLCFSITGLLTVISCFDNSSVRKYIWAGFLLGSAPFWRQTGITGIVACLIFLLIIMIFVKGENRFKISKNVFWILCFSLLFAGIWLLTSIILGSDFNSLWNTLVAFNINYSKYNRDAISIGKFLTHDRFTLLLIILLLFWIINPRSKSKKIIDSGDYLKVLLLGVWWVIEVSVAIILRKSTGYYYFGIIFSSFLLGFAYLVVFNKNHHYYKKIFLSLTIIVFIYSLSKVPIKLFNNEMFSQKRQPTGQIISILRNSRKVKSSRMLVIGNRANLYTLALDFGIRPYKWVTFSTILDDNVKIFLDEKEDFKNEFLNDPPEYIIRVGSANGGFKDTINWLSNRLENDYICQNKISSSKSQWPYKYQYEIYVLKKIE
jgi:hypothetical protein